VGCYFCIAAPYEAYMLDQDTITQQQELLAAHRRTLAHLVQQAAQYGGDVFAPPQTANGIAEARAQVRRIKAALREGGLPVEDEPNDEGSSQVQPVQPQRAGGDQTTINSDGGDVAGRDIDSRQGETFVEGSAVIGDIIGGDKIGGDKVGGDKISVGDISGSAAVAVGTGAQATAHIYYQAPPTPLDRQQQRNRRAMLAKVKAIWIDGLLEQSLAKELRIDLDLTEQPDAVDLPLNTQVQELNHPPRQLPAAMSIIEVFDQMGGALLILGAPGAGKTTLLLELARDLIARVEQDEEHPIPVVFNLSSWAEKRRPLKEWLVEELKTKYNVPRKLAQAWVDADAVLPLLDGLDEVAADHREACVEAINAYRQEQGLVPLTVCSRVVDYKVLMTKLRLQGAIVVQPLTKQQIDAFVERIGEKLAGMRTAVQEDAALQEMLDTPLMLCIVVLAYKERFTTKLRAVETLKERRRRVFDDYIGSMFSRRGIPVRYSKEKTYLLKKGGS
jgi:GTPase SAR1 family protein